MKAFGEKESPYILDLLTEKYKSLAYKLRIFRLIHQVSFYLLTTLYFSFIAIYLKRVREDFFKENFYLIISIVLLCGILTIISRRYFYKFKDQLKTLEENLTKEKILRTKDYKNLGSDIEDIYIELKYLTQEPAGNRRREYNDQIVVSFVVSVITACFIYFLI